MVHWDRPKKMKHTSLSAFSFINTHRQSHKHTNRHSQSFTYLGLEQHLTRKHVSNLGFLWDQPLKYKFQIYIW
jgi:hypothetical protein